MSALDLAQKGEAGYILVDFDRTLGKYLSWEKNGKALGEPIAPTVERVKRWREDGLEVRIFTARANPRNPHLAEDLEAIHNWCMEVFGEQLLITCQKDFGCIAIVDDLAISIEPNTGAWLIDHPIDPITPEEELILIGDSQKPSEG